MPQLNYIPSPTGGSISVAPTSIATTSNVGTVKPDGITTKIASDGTLSVVGKSAHDLNVVTTLTGTEEVAVYTLGADYKATLSTIKNYIEAAAPTAPTAPTPSISIIPPNAAITNSASTATVNFTGATLPLSYSLDNGLFTPLSNQPANGAATVSITLLSLSAGTHTILVKDYNNVLSNNGTPTTFTVAAVTSGPHAAGGVPTYGIGLYQDVLAGNTATADNGYDKNIDNQILQTGMNPPLVLVFPGTFQSIGDITYRYNTEATGWKNNTNTNGSKRPIPIPVIGFPMQYLDGGFTHRSVVTGAYDDDIGQVVAAWAGAGVPELWVRLAWEIDYPTTPSSQGAQNGAYGSGATANSNDSAYCAEFIGAYRHIARVMRAKAVSLGLVFKSIWEPANISYCQLDPRLMFPDNDISDGYGKQVDINGMDFYYNNFYGATVPILHDGYDKQAPFTPFAATGTAPDIPTWAQNKGSLYYFGDYTDGNSSDPYGWGHGWSFFEFVYFAKNCPLGPNPIFHPEGGGVTFLDGGNNGNLTVTQPDGPAGSYDQYGPFFSPYEAGYLRSRWAYAQSIGVEVYGICLWFYQSNQCLQTYAAAFPEKTIGYTGPIVSQVAVPSPTISVVTPEYHVKPNVPFDIKCFWGVSQPSSLEFSTDGGATYKAQPATINADRTIHISYAFPAPGSYRLAVRDANNHAVLGMTNWFNINNTGQAYIKSYPALYPGSKTFRITAKIQPNTITSAGFIFGIWPNSANYSYVFYIDSNGTLNILYFDGTNYIGGPSTVALPSAIVNNPTFVRGTVTISTGVIVLETSPDGNTWTQLGNTITSTLTTPVNNTGLARGAYACIGGADDGNSLFSGKIFEVKLEVNNSTVFDYNFATQAIVNNTSTDSIGNVWTVYNPAVTVANAGSSNNTATPALLNNMTILNNAIAGSNTITLPNAATAGNHVLLLQNSYNEPAPNFVPATPNGFTNIGRVHASDNEDFVAFFGPVSALVNNGVTFTTELNQDAGYGAFVLVETTAGHATTAPLSGITNGSSFPVTVPSQGGFNPLRLGIFNVYALSQGSGFSATQGNIVFQNNGAGANANVVLFTQADGNSPVQFTQTAGVNCQDLHGIGLELTT